MSADLATPSTASTTTTPTNPTDSIDSPQLPTEMPSVPQKRDVTWQDLDAANSIQQLGCLSRVLAPNGSWYTRDLLIPHEAIRYDMLLMERIVQPQYFQPRRAWKVKRLFAWYRRYFLTPVHHHHDAEERLYFTLIQSKPGVVIPQRMSDDHAMLMKQLDEVSNMEQKFARTMDEAELEVLAAELRSRVSAMCNNMRDHLAEEEEIVPPLLRDHFKKEELVDVTNKIIGSRGLDNLYLAPNELICQQRSGGDESVQFMLGLMPGVARAHYRRFGSTWYGVEHLAYLNHIAIDSDIEPKQVKAQGCGLCRWYE